jgi:hypothetical protein
LSEHENQGHRHTITIVVNGQEVTVEDKDISYVEVTAIAYPELVTNPDAMFTVTYRKGGNENQPEGQLLPGASVKVKKNMVFDVVPTTKS